MKIFIFTYCRFITDPIHGEIEVPAVCQGEFN